MADKYHFLNVGCNDCSILHLGDKVIMVDCHQGNADNGEDNILNYLPAKKIDLLILTHQHYDHFDGIQTLLDNDIQVVEIWESCYERRRNDNSVKYDEWNDYQKLKTALGAKVYQPTKSTENFSIVGGAGIQIYNPPQNVNDNETRELHDACLVFTIRKGNMTVTFTGDASDTALQFVIDNFEIKEKYILHASHHGSINGANLEFIKTIKPEYTIISTKSGVYENVPHPTALQRYKSHTKQFVRRTDIDGTRTFTV